MAWAWLMVPLAAIAVAVAPSMAELPPARGTEWPVPAPAQDDAVWTIRMEPGPTHAQHAFLAGVQAMDGVRGRLVVTTGPADLVVHWAHELQQGGRLGQHVLGTPRIEVALGDSRCLGGWTPYDERTLVRVVAHEIGHAIGLAHEAGTVMAEDLPAAYGQRCVVDSGELGLLPLQTLRVPFHVEQGEAQFTVRSDGAVGTCIVPAEAQRMAGWGCTHGERTAGSVALPAGSYALAVRCVGLLGCDLHHELVTRPTS